MKVSQHIKAIRQRQNLTQEEFATQLAVSRQAVSKWERGTALPDIENLMYISDLYNVSLDEIIKGDPALGQKIVADTAAKKWHRLSIVFFILLLAYIAYVGLNHGVWHIGLAIATAFMLGIDLSILLRKKTFRNQHTSRRVQGKGA